MKPVHLARWVIGMLVVAGLGIGGWYALARAKSGSSGDSRAEQEARKAVVVEVALPRQGGIPRQCTQPGTVEPFDAADLFAKVSGFLVEQSVDIGSRVKAGDVLAIISVPEYDKQVERDEARLRHAEARVKQMEAHVRAATAEAKAAEVSVTLARVMVKAKAAFRRYREKQRDRIKALVADNAETGKLLDEQEDYYQSAIEAENAAAEQVNTNLEKATAARAMVTQAEADVDEAKAEVGVAQAELAKSRVLLQYTIITAPYDGVVTKRNFHAGKDRRPGDFIKAADQGGTIPLLAVERTDIMRVVVQVPDRDVPYVSRDSTAVIEIDALPNAKYGAKPSEPLTVSRWATAEDYATRTMRTEIDVRNDGALVHGMYGRVTITLAPGVANSVRIPSAALFGKSEGGRGQVRVVRGGTVHILPVVFALDNGIDAEVVSGLNSTDQVIVRATGPIEEGTAVTVHEEAGTAGR
jgi:RND family efflux transporter MFP subunit